MGRHAVLRPVSLVVINKGRRGHDRRETWLSGFWSSLLFTICKLNFSLLFFPFRTYSVSSRHEGVAAWSKMDKSSGPLPAGLPIYTLILLPLGTYCLWSLFSYISSPLRKYPGPFLARENFSAPPKHIRPGVTLLVPFSSSLGATFIRLHVHHILTSYQKLIHCLFTRMDQTLVPLSRIDGRIPPRIEAASRETWTSYSDCTSHH